MYAPIAERAIPYEQYMSRDAEHIYSRSRVTPRSAPAASRVATEDSHDMRQFNREPTVISTSSSVDGDAKATIPSAASRSSDKTHSTIIGGDITAGFDSNTLKRMLQTLPELSTPVDLMQEFEEEFADVVGPSTGGEVAARDDVKERPPLAMPPPPPAPPPPLTDEDGHRPSTSSVVTAVDQPADVLSVPKRTDVIATSSDGITAPENDVSNEKTEAENGNIELRNGERAVAPVHVTDAADVALTIVTSSGTTSRSGFA